MQATFHLQAAELTDDFFAVLKSLVNSHTLTLTLTLETEQTAQIEDWDDSWEDTDGLDETERIRRNPALHAEIMRSLEQANAGNLITLDMDTILAGALPKEAVISRPMEMAA
jgi:hypothetical protein